MLKGKESSSLGGAEQREAGVCNSRSAEPESTKPASSTLCRPSSIQSPHRCASQVPGCPETSPGRRDKGTCGHSVLFTLRVSSVSPLCGRDGGGPNTASIGKSALGLSSDSSLVAPGNMWPVGFHL